MNRTLITYNILAAIILFSAVTAITMQPISINAQIQPLQQQQPSTQPPTLDNQQQQQPQLQPPTLDNDTTVSTGSPSIEEKSPTEGLFPPFQLPSLFP